ncbi:MAG: DNA translocase FtsK 4TM domain-containing protein, partial [Bacteroidaceae bacterium]|nr:DNA translocase FtsK 4TM domain-containing protein [Bacteroidaceae bacterium]
MPKTKKTTSKKQNSPGFIQAIGLNKIFSNDIISFFAGLILLVISVLTLISFISYFDTGAADQSIVLDLRPDEWMNTDKQFTNAIGSFGAIASHFLVCRCFGLAAFCFILLCALCGLRLMNLYEVNLVKIFLMLAFLTIWLSVFFAACFSSIWGEMFENAVFLPGGDHGEHIRQAIENVIGFPGVIALLIVTAIGFLTYLSTETIRYIKMLLNPTTYNIPKVKFKITNTGEGDQIDNTDEAPAAIIDTDYDDDPVVFDNPEPQQVTFTVEGADTERIAAAPATPQQQPGEPEVTITAGVQAEKADGGDVSGQQDVLTPINPKEPFVHYKYPVLDLLNDYGDDGKPYINMEEQNANKNRIIEVLNNFGVDVSSIQATVGPTITLYEITLGPGIRISKIRSLSDDIALGLSALGVRIIAPMPGKGTVGIEVPNKHKNIVSMESILNSKKFQETKMSLPLALGKTITNDVFMVDLAKIPHLLVAGATGQGKSVGLNAIITSLLYKKHPNELKFVLIDPKKVEFSVYAKIQNHFMAKLEEEEDAIITDVRKVVKTLNSLCKLMDTRYDLLKL